METVASQAVQRQSAALPTVHMFWHGSALTRVERMCMASFVAHDHRVHLHVYDEPSDVPNGVTIVDARRILAEQTLFRHPKSGSMAMFADWFRYRVLYEQGGVWADTDVVCLQPLSYPHAEIYAWEDGAQINNAVLGLPASHELALWMANCCEQPNKILPYDDGRSKRRKWRRWLTGNRRSNVKWGEYGPMGFTAAARHLGYLDTALPHWHFYPIHYRQWQTVFDQPRDIASLGQARALHLWNEMLRREPGFDKNARFAEGTLFEQLCSRYLSDG